MLKRNSFVKQEQIKDCGPAVVLMLIKYYKGYIPMEKLKELCHTNQNGTSAYYMVEALKEIGFNAMGVRVSLEDFNSTKIILPCIAHVIINKSYNHYIVINEINYHKQKLTISDPTNGIKKMSFKEFNDIFNNILILAYPIKRIEVYKKISLTTYLLNIFKLRQKECLRIFLLSIITTVLGITSSFYFQSFIDHLNTTKSYLIFLLVIFLTIFISKEINDYIRNRLLIIFNQKNDLSLTLETFNKLILLPYKHFRNNTTGDIISRISDLNIVREMINKVALNMFLDLPISIIALTALYFLNNKLFIIILLVLFIYLLIMIIFKPIIENMIKKGQTEKSNVTSYMFEALSGFETIKGLGIEEPVKKRFEQKYVILSNLIYKLDNAVNNQTLLKNILDNVGNLMIIFMGILLVFNNQMTLGALLTFNIITNYFFSPLRNIIDMDYSIKEAASALKRILELFDHQVTNGIIDKPLLGDIKINHLSYSYNQLDYIIKDINISINAGEKVMLTGPSGIGKSTILKLIMKYYDLKRDTILINNYDINDLKKECIAKNISYISQNEILFTDSLINNLNLVEANEDDILDNAKLCYVDDIIKDNSLGYYALIEENGFNLSGGQKQRIILARTISKAFNILLIDEGLNQIDIALERNILINLFNKFKDKTIIIVSHRLNNADLYDKVYQINKDSVKEIKCSQSMITKTLNT